MYVTVKKFSANSGHSENSIYRRISEGQWSSDNKVIARIGGRVLISEEGYEKWVEDQAQKPSQKHQSKSVLSLKGNATVSESRSPQPLKI